MSGVDKRLASRRELFDWPLFWVVALLLGAGLVMVFSASIAVAEAKHMGGGYFMIRQGIYIAVGVVAGIGAFRVPMERWREWAPTLFIVGGVLLLLVLVPGIGKVVNGSRRWIGLAVMNLQPSEFMKLFAALYAADYALRKGAYIESFKRGFLPMLIVMLFIGALLLKEPDFGAFVVIVSISMAILFMAGVNGKQFGGLVVALVLGFALIIASSSYRRARVLGYMDPWKDELGKGYQLAHALIAFGRGEWFGVGLGGSVEKLFYLPEAHTDFLLAVIAEEFGFFGVVVILAMFVWLVMRAFAIAKQAIAADKQFSALVAYGLGVWLGVQAIINIGVNMGLLPTKGLTLPLLSYGGSGIVANCVAVAILLRIDWETRMAQHGYKI